jgi:hypothetical protein
VRFGWAQRKVVFVGNGRSNWHCILALLGPNPWQPVSCKLSQIPSYFTTLSLMPNVTQANVLITENGRAAISDTGLGSTMHRIVELDGSSRVPQRWNYKPPEELAPVNDSHFHPTAQADTYAFAGIVYAVSSDQPHSPAFLFIQRCPLLVADLCAAPSVLASLDDAARVRPGHRRYR